MTRAQFLSMYTWDTVNDMWVMKAGMTLPEGIKSRAEVKAERDLYLSMHKYDSRNQLWVPMTTPRNMSTMTRAQVRAETAAFMRTHRWDETSSKWDLKTTAGSN
jgi:hypothetical protein